MTENCGIWALIASFLKPRFLRHEIGHFVNREQRPVDVDE